MEKWAFAIKIGVLCILFCQSGRATDTSPQVSDVGERVLNRDLDTTSNAEGEEISLAETYHDLPSGVSEILADGVDPSAGPSMDVMDTNLKLDTEKTSPESEEPVVESERGNADVGTSNIDVTSGAISSDEILSSDVDVVKSQVNENNDDTPSEVEGKAPDDEGKLSTDDGNGTQDTSKALSNEEQIPNDTDALHTDNPEIHPVNNNVENSETPKDPKVLFESKDKLILMKVADETAEVLPGTVLPTAARSEDGVMVYNQRVYPGKVCSDSVQAESGDLAMPPPPLDPTCDAWSWDVTVGDGYYADVTLKWLNVSHEANEFMIIGPGSSVSDLWEDQSNPMLTSVITSEKKFRMLGAETFSVLLVTNTPSGFKGGFRLSYERAERIETTPYPTTPAPTLPSPAANITTEIRVYLSGKTAHEFNETSVEFRQLVAEMSNIYCNENNIPMKQNSTYQNVVLSLIRQCDLTWPHHDYCVQVNMSVAVILPTNQPLEFELTAEHLQDMWDTMADQPSSGLADLGLEVYYVPDHKANFTIWLGGSLVILILFVVILMLVWRMEIFREYSRMVDKRDSTFSHRSSTMSDDSWFPSTDHQLVPPYMDMYSQVGYVEYEPEFNGPMPTPKYQKPVAMTVETAPAYNGPPPRYGPPVGLGFNGATHFYGNTKRDFDNPAFVEEHEDNLGMEEEVNTGELKYPTTGFTMPSIGITLPGIGFTDSTNNNSSC